MDAVYLDNNATTRPAAEVVEAVTRALRDLWANPSSVHRAGERVRQEIELAREQVCRLVGCEPRELIFTSGGTEATNLAIRGSLEGGGGRGVLVTDRLEHSATRETAEALGERGVELVWLELDPRNGLISIDALRDLLSKRADEVAVVSVQWANNETGAIQPVEAIGAACREHGVRFHCDATQWVGKMPCDFRSMPVDLATFAAHKFHGPKGIGGLYIRRGVRLAAEITGGPQERQRRGGTENVPGILGMAAAAEVALSWLQTDERTRLAALRDRFESSLLQQAPGASVNGADCDRLWNTSNIAFPRLEAEAILLLLSERGVFASAGAACSSGSLDPSPVLLAMGVPPERAHGSVRFSLSRETAAAEIDRALEVIPAVIGKLQATLSV